MNRVLVSMLVLLSMFAPVLGADDALKNALSIVPSNAMAVVCIPNVKTMDSDFQAAIQRLEMQPMMPFQSLVAFVQQQAPFLAGMNTDGALTLVIMPALSLPELGQKQVVIVPSKDPQAMIESMGGEAGEAGMWTVLVFGQPAQATVHKEFMLIGQTPEVLKAFKESETTLATKFDSPDLAAMAGLDVVLWMDAEQLVTLVKPMVQMMMQGMVAMQASAGAFAQKSAEMNVQQVNMLMDGASSMGMGIGLGEAGVTFRGTFKAKPGTELAKQANIKVTAEPLLEGLPAARYVLAFGSTISPGQAEQAMKNFEPLVALLSGVEGINQEKVTAMRGHFEKMMAMATGMRALVEPLPPGGPDGLVGVTVVSGTTDSAASLDLAKQAFDLAKEMVNDAGDKVSPEVKSVIDAITWERGAEDVAGVKVDVFKLDLSKLPDVEESDVADLHSVIGKDGVLLRMAPANATTLVTTFGGGAERLTQALEQAKSSAAPLAQDAGIQKIAAHLPQQHNQVMYLAFDHGLELVQNIMKAIDEEPLPFATPQVDAPMAMASTGGDGWMQFDVLVPMDLIVAGKNIGMSMMGGQPPAGGLPPAVEPPAAAPAEEEAVDE